MRPWQPRDYHCEGRQYLCDKPEKQTHLLVPEPGSQTLPRRLKQVKQTHVPQESHPLGFRTPKRFGHSSVNYSGPSTGLLPAQSPDDLPEVRTTRRAAGPELQDAEPSDDHLYSRQTELLQPVDRLLVPLRFLRLQCYRCGLTSLICPDHVVPVQYRSLQVPDDHPERCTRHSTRMPEPPFHEQHSVFRGRELHELREEACEPSRRLQMYHCPLTQTSS